MNLFKKQRQAPFPKNDTAWLVWTSGVSNSKKINQYCTIIGELKIKAQTKEAVQFYEKDIRFTTSSENMRNTIAGKWMEKKLFILEKIKRTNKS